MISMTLCFMIYTFLGDVFQDAGIYLSGIEGIQLVEDPSGKIILQGQILRDSDRKRIHKFLNRFPQVQSQISGLREAKKLEKIFVEFSLVEVQKSAFEKMGIHLSPSISLEGAFQIGATNMIGLGTMDPVRAFLDLALQSGSAQIHAKQSLVARENELGRFQIGGQFPIKTVSGYMSRVEFKDFGLILSFRARLKNSKVVDISVQSEISEIDMGSMVDGIPVITKKVLKTQVDLPLNQMTALGGLIRQSESSHREGIPGLSEIPGLGRLFRSEDFKKQKSEAFLFILVKRMEVPWIPSPDL